MSSKPYPWPKPAYLSSKEAPKVYKIERKIQRLFKDLDEELEGLIGGHKWRERVPYILFCQLEGFDIESSIAACFGFLQHVRAQDEEYGVERLSLKGLVLPPEPEEK